MLVLALIGAWSYRQLGQSEDPPFTFKAMVVRTLWPGATAEEVSRQVTERIEKKLMETGKYEFIRSYSRAGRVAGDLHRRATRCVPRKSPTLWYQVRKKVGDIRATLPQGVVGPFFNDEFGDTFGNIYALTGKGFDYAVLKDYAERVELELQRVPDVGKVDLVGLQDEKVWIELSNTKLATLGVPAGGGAAGAGRAERGGAGRLLRDRQRPRAAARQRRLRLGRGDPRLPDPRRRPHLPPRRRRRRCAAASPIRPRRACASWARTRSASRVAMKDGGDILKLGETLEAEFARLQKTLPAGMELRKVSDQPAAVQRIGRRVRARAGRGGGDRAAGELLLARASAPAWWWRCRSRWCWR